ncbi:hypothetical protein [Trichlorobacter lovleyi]|uniref:DUF5666 domain-containing protein n=1 Tax=Trichlorobacter lovleyi (strain ATCC BAA-1151 / DSM 17278 / SZ) TaxID=398767 RepID=B3E6S0_TRIL1|nr:hypothetical protein [Trichlorobacter lovleyi]ACD94895.1 conserved hypothetical protein [Trichlorobacter lovleyi SZ]
MKKILVMLTLSLFAATAAFAAEGKVVSVADGQAVVEMGADAKFKKGAGVKLNGKAGKVTAVDGTKLTIKASNAADLKAGDTVKVDKMASMQGC